VAKFLDRLDARVQSPKYGGMAQTGSNDVFEVLVALLAAHDTTTVGNNPVERVVARIERSIELAGQTALTDASVHLDKQDFAWLCNALGVDRLSMARFRMKVSGLVVYRSMNEDGSYIRGFWAGKPAALPIIQDPVQSLDRSQGSDWSDDALSVTEKRVQCAQQLVLKDMDPRATRQ
jgi:hypothetical protein